MRSSIVIAPDIKVNKTASLTGTCPGSDPLAVSVGDTVTYCFNVSNTGDVNLTSVKVIDNIYGHVLATPLLAPGESIEGMVTHTVVKSDEPSVTNTANATGTDPLGGTVNDTDDCTINVTIHPDVKLEKTSSPAIVAPGGNVTYTINYTNTGTVPLTDVVITEHYPKGVTFISASPAPDVGNNVWIIGNLSAGESGTIVINVKVPEQIDLYFTETGSVIGEGVVMVTKDLSTEQKPYSLRNRVTLSCDELDPKSAYATTKVSGVPGTSLGITESGSGVYSSDENLDLETKNRTIILKKSTNAEYKPTSFNFSDSFSVNFTNKWKQDICSRNMEIDAAIHKKISDATYIDDETISRVDKDKSIMNFDSSFNGSMHIGARTKDTEISETYIGEFDVSQTIQIGKGPIPTPAPTPTPTPIWLPCPFNDSQEMNTTEEAEPTHDAKIKIEKSANRTSATVGDVIRYSYVVTNIGNINLTGVTVTDSRLGLVDLNRTELEPTEVASGTLLYTVNQSDVCANITNTADVTATDGCGGTVTNTSNQVIVTTDS